MLVLFFGAATISLLLVFTAARLTKKFGIVGIDINKADKRIIPESAGIGIAAATAAGFALYFAATAFNTEAAIALGAALVFALLGFVDDCENKFLKKSTSWKARAAVIAVVSLVFAVCFSHNILWIIFASLFIAGLASLQNTFAGLNGWEVGSGFIISVFLAIALQESGVAELAWIFSGCVFGLLMLNIYPAKVFPGDSGTLFIGSMAAGLAVASGNPTAMVLLLLFYLPHLVDFFLLKLLTNPKDVTQETRKPYALLENGKLALPEKGKLDFAKLLLKLLGPKKEWQVVGVIWLVVSVNCLFWLYVFTGFPAV